MSKFVERIAAGNAEVTDSGSVVLHAGSTDFELVVEGLLVKVKFSTALAGDPVEFVVRVGDQNEVIYDIREPEAASDFTIHSPRFATADDGRQLSISFYVKPINGSRGVSRFIAYTVAAS